MAKISKELLKSYPYPVLIAATFIAPSAGGILFLPFFVYAAAAGIQTVSWSIYMGFATLLMSGLSIATIVGFFKSRSWCRWTAVITLICMTVFITINLTSKINEVTTNNDSTVIGFTMRYAHMFLQIGLYLLLAYLIAFGKKSQEYFAKFDSENAQQVPVVPDSRSFTT